MTQGRIVNIIFSALRVAGIIFVTAVAGRIAGAQDAPVITLQRTGCFGTCPIYSLEIFADGFVRYVGTRFVQVSGEHKSVLQRDKVEDLISQFLQAGYFLLQDNYETYRAHDGQIWHVTDLPTAYSSFRYGDRRKSIRDYAFAPRELTELEIEIDRVANTHRWIHGDKDNLKQWEFVQTDVYWRTKPGMNRFMQAAGIGDLKQLESEYDAGIDINASDETGWTALMLASAMCQESAVRRLLDWGAKPNLKDKNGDTALIGASSAFCVDDKSRKAQAKIARMLLDQGADANAQDFTGQTALMAVSKYGSLGALRELIAGGAQPDVKDNNGRSALDFAREALAQAQERFWTDELKELVAVLETQR
jgi:hypothetical protein